MAWMQKQSRAIIGVSNEAGILDLAPRVAPIEQPDYFRGIGLPGEQLQFDLWPLLRGTSTPLHGLHQSGRRYVVRSVYYLLLCCAGDELRLILQHINVWVWGR